MIVTSHYNSPIGKLLLAAQENALLGLWIEGQKYFPGNFWTEQATSSAHPILTKARIWLDRYFAGEKPEIAELHLAPEGSAFRQQVWRILCRIPYGQVRTYGEIAAELAQLQGTASMSAQAVGGAVGHNPISIIIPCHRVVGSDGSLTGYAGGLEKKIQLLSHEHADLTRLYRPAKGTAL